MAQAKQSQQRRGGRRVKKSVPRGQAHIHATFNNTIVTMTDTQRAAIRLLQREHNRLQMGIQ